MDGKKKLFNTDDFFLNPLIKEPEVIEQKKQSVDDMKLILTGIASAFPGKKK